MTQAGSPDSCLGRNAVDPQGDKIGSIAQVYVDDQTGAPDWITVNTGLFGTTEKFIPLAGASFQGDDVLVPFDKSVVKDSPEITDADHLDNDEQEQLYQYYGRHQGAGVGGTTVGTGQAGFSDTDRRDTDDLGTGVGAAGTGTAGAGSAGVSAGGVGTADVADADRGRGHDTSGPNTDDAMTRSEEHLRVGTEQVEAGRARLRKYVVTEQQTVQVPVTREEVRVEREPITEANRGDALSGGEITEEEHEVVLHEERPVVTTEAVPVERVRLGTETVTEQQTVSGEVRKEEIEVDDPTTGTGRGQI